MSTSLSSFLEARDFLLVHRADYEKARREFRWPKLDQFNWALDYFDSMAKGNDRPALWVVDEGKGETKLSFAEMSRRSNQVANFLRAQGVKRGDAVLMMLGNVVPLWEVMLACMKLGAVIIPATTLLNTEDLRDRFERGGVRHVIVGDADTGKFDALAGRLRPDRGRQGRPGLDEPRAVARRPGRLRARRPDERERPPPALLHLRDDGEAEARARTPTRATPSATSPRCTGSACSPGTCTSTSARRDGRSTPGRTSSRRGTPARPSSSTTTRGSTRRRPSTSSSAAASPRSARRPRSGACSIQEDLAKFPVKIRELVGAGEPLNPEVIDQVKKAWGITIRDGYGQTETTCQIGNSPGQAVKPGSMGRPMPGYEVALLGDDDQPAKEGEICLEARPAAGRAHDGLQGRPGEDRAPHARRPLPLRRRRHRSTTTATSPTSAAPTTSSSPPTTGSAPSSSRAPSSSTRRWPRRRWCRARIRGGSRCRRRSSCCATAARRAASSPSPSSSTSARRSRPTSGSAIIEFAELPKTISGKIRRTELSKQEKAKRLAPGHGEREFFEDDFPELRA